MRKYSYKAAVFLSRYLGVWFFRIFSWFVATGYFFFFPTRVACSLKLYRALFPERNVIHLLYCVWRQYHNFTGVFLDRFIYSEENPAEFTAQGWEYLEEAVKNKTGAIVVMSHVGNWELAAQRLGGRGLPILLYIGEKQREQIERLQKENLAGGGIKIVSTPENEESPFALLEGLNFLRAGGIVSMTGDRLWGRQSFVSIDFLGYEAKLPAAPHLFALLSGAPLLTFFVHKKARGKYHITVHEGRRVIAASRADRKRAVRESVQEYATKLANFARRHPFEVYHFEPFLGGKIEKGEKAKKQ